MRLSSKMSINIHKYKEIEAELTGKATLVAVSKTKPAEDIKAMYDLGQRDFGENYVQELSDKYEQLPKDIRWHFIGHLQSNKVKFIAPFVHLVHGVDSLGLMKEINKQALKNNRIINCLLQIHIAKEETKFGLSSHELLELTQAIKADDGLKNIAVQGLMGMASFSNNADLVKSEFRYLKDLYNEHAEWSILSMGMSTDYKIALQEGSNMVRIGSMIFGERNLSTGP